MTSTPRQHHTRRDQIPIKHPGQDRTGHEGDSGGHGAHDDAVVGGVNSMALSATLHCLTGCAVGEIAGLMIGTAIGLSTAWTIGLAVSLAFLFGYAVSTLPLLKTGLGLGAALSLVLAADTLSIATMEVVDNAVMALIPGAMDAGLANAEFWISMMIALTAAFFAAYPVNRYLLRRGRGHALTHSHQGPSVAIGARRYIPDLRTSSLVTAIVAFMLGGLIVSLAAELGEESVNENGSDSGGHALP